jgi:hypothetical protein
MISATMRRREVSFFIVITSFQKYYFTADADKIKKQKIPSIADAMLGTNFKISNPRYHPN